MLFSFSFFSLSKNHGVRARMRFTGSTDGITSADMTHRPKSICLFSNRPSHGREETSAYHGSNGYVEGGCPQTSCMFHHALSRKGKNERCSRCRVTQIPSTEEVLKCGDVWTEPSVSVATLHPLPHPHFAIQNKHSSLWMCVISLCHNTDRQSLSLTPQRQCKPQHENAALRCSGGKRPKCSEIGIPGRWDAHHRKVRKKTQGRDFRSVWGLTIGKLCLIFETKRLKYLLSDLSGDHFQPLCMRVRTRAPPSGGFNLNAHYTYIVVSCYAPLNTFVLCLYVKEHTKQHQHKEHML